MSAREIRKLVDDFHIELMSHDDAEHEVYHNNELSKAEKEEWEADMEYHHMNLIEVADEILKLKPSAYMINKYPILEDIINGNY